jgi:hypothetical protein
MSSKDLNTTTTIDEFLPREALSEIQSSTCCSIIICTDSLTAWIGAEAGVNVTNASRKLDTLAKYFVSAVK